MRGTIVCILAVCSLLTTNMASAENCTLTQGFWKNHQEVWPIPVDTEICEQTWLDNLKNPTRGDAWYILSHQWIAASLNIAKGADPADLGSAMDDAEALLLSCIEDTSDRNLAITLSQILDQFNNGIIGPGHCDFGPTPTPTPNPTPTPGPDPTPIPTPSPTPDPTPTPVYIDLMNSCSPIQLKFSKNYSKVLDRLKVNGRMALDADYSDGATYELRNSLGVIDSGYAKCNYDVSGKVCLFKDRSAKKLGGVERFVLKNKNGWTKMQLFSHGLFADKSIYPGMCLSVKFDGVSSTYEACGIWDELKNGWKIKFDALRSIN